MLSWSIASSHLFASSLALLVYVLGSRAGHERRAPAAAVAWVLALLSAPYLALPLYLAFGRRKLPRLRGPNPDPLPPDVPWPRRMTAGLGLEPPAPSHPRFHADGEEARRALLALIDSARVRLDVCTFLLGKDRTGHEVIEHLVRAVGRGVRVRLLLDGIGVALAPWGALRRLHKAGGEVKVFRPLVALRSDAPRNLRNHRKLTIADGARLWSGGRNLADEYFLGDGARPPWIDLSFDLDGATAAAAARSFEADWLIARGRPAPAIENAPPRRMHGGETQYLPSGPDQIEDTAHALITAGCYHARRRIVAVTPYFVPDETLTTALRLAARRGVHVKLVLPARSNHRLADFARNRPLRQLVAAGVDVHLVPRMVHAKALVFDERLALCGSINLDPRSLLLNHEAAVVFHDAVEITWLTHWIDALGADAPLYAPEQPGLLRDLAEGMVSTLAFQL